jgi:hypothetical protein
MAGVDLDDGRGPTSVIPEAERTALVGGPREIRAVEMLRRRAYQRAPEFDVLKRSAYEWTPADDRGYVLAVWSDDNTALATMRGTVVAGRDEAETQLECAVPLAPTFFPALVLERGATCADRSHTGLNSLMRYYFIEAALRLALGSVLGAVFDGAPRLRLLAKLGYEFSKPERVWDPNIAPRTSVLIASLARARMAEACALLLTSLRDVHERFRWYGQPMADATPARSDSRGAH